MRTSRNGLSGLPSGCTRQMIAKQKVKHFVKLYDRVRLFVNTYEEADNKCNVDHCTVWKMKNEDFLTKETAGKILAAYNKLTA